MQLDAGQCDAERHIEEQWRIDHRVPGIDSLQEGLVGVRE